MLLLQANRVYQAGVLSALDWVEHGFGTRASVWLEPERLASLKQVHSDVVLEVSAPGLAGAGDGLITNEPGLLVGVKTADCVPILLADVRNRAVAAVHAGWKGTAQGIVLKAIEAMSASFGTRAEDLRVGAGPCIQACCYEVGPEVAEQFQRWMPELSIGKQKLDLVEVNLRQLKFAGVQVCHTHHGAPCTFCRPGELHSYRRDGLQAGRMMSAIGVRRGA